MESLRCDKWCCSKCISRLDEWPCPKHVLSAPWTIGLLASATRSEARCTEFINSVIRMRVASDRSASLWCCCKWRVSKFITSWFARATGDGSLGSKVRLSKLVQCPCSTVIIQSHVHRLAFLLRATCPLLLSLPMLLLLFQVTCDNSPVDNGPLWLCRWAKFVEATV